MCLESPTLPDSSSYTAVLPMHTRGRQSTVAYLKKDKSFINPPVIQHLLSSISIIACQLQTDVVNQYHVLCKEFALVFWCIAINITVKNHQGWVTDYM